jgi:hypothetical protein
MKDFLCEHPYIDFRGEITIFIKQKTTRLFLVLLKEQIPTKICIYFRNMPVFSCCTLSHSENCFDLFSLSLFAFVRLLNYPQGECVDVRVKEKSLFTLTHSVSRFS